jgi:hypothetical protein
VGALLLEVLHLLELRQAAHQVLQVEFLEVLLEKRLGELQVVLQVLLLYGD